MNILLDENLDWRLGRDLTGHAVVSVPQIGWAGVKNGVLLRQADEQFDVLITMDKGIYHQQNLAGLRLVIIALQAKTNRLADTRPLVPAILQVLANAPAGEYHAVSVA
jgi:predicted nuclease of predicted toxin-antitoxin system